MLKWSYASLPNREFDMLLFAYFLAMQMSHQEEAICKPGECLVKAETKAPVLQESLNNGHYIRLSDNSLWEIDPKDTALTQSWITPVEIIISPSQDPNYPYQLTNTLTGSTVHAKRVTNLPGK